jgi:hypothetical protein
MNYKRTHRNRRDRFDLSAWYSIQQRKSNW